MQVGIVVADVEETARAWSQILGLPMPEITLTDEIQLAQTAPASHALGHHPDTPLGLGVPTVLGPDGPARLAGPADHAVGDRGGGRAWSRAPGGHVAAGAPLARHVATDVRWDPRPAASLAAVFTRYRDLFEILGPEAMPPDEDPL